jgi:hypothetical protein
LVVMKRGLWIFVGAVLATAGHAYAQEATTPADRAAVRAEVPWYERFTYSHGPTETMTGLGPSDRTAQPAWALSQRWGVTVDMRGAERSAPIGEPGVRNETSVGAFYNFTPSVRVGGQVSLRPAESPTARAPGQDEPLAGVRLESAFKF